MPATGSRQVPRKAVTTKRIATTTAMPARIALAGRVAWTSAYEAPAKRPELPTSSEYRSSQ